MSTSPHDSDRRIIVSQLYVACVLILGGAVLGLVGYKVADAAIGATLGTAVIGAGAALLPSGAAASAAARAFTPPAAPTVTVTTPPAGAAPAPSVDSLLAAEEPDAGQAN